MKLLKKIKQKMPGTAKASAQGQPVTVYNSPTGTRRKGTAARNVTRIQTLQYAMDKLEGRGLKESKEFKSLKAEMARRILHFEEDRIREDD